MGCHSSDSRGEVNAIANYQLNRQDYLKAPHQSVGVLTFVNRHNQKAKGTAILISQNTILTAAVNVYDKENNQQYRNFRFYLAPWGNTNLRSAYLLKRWKYIHPIANRRQEGIQFDYAIMISSEKIKRNIQGEYAQITVVCPECTFQFAQSNFVNIQGYPSSESKANALYTVYKEQISGLHQYKLPIQLGSSPLTSMNTRLTYQMKVGLVCQNGMVVTYDDKFIGLHFYTKDKGDKIFFSSLFTIQVLKLVKKWSQQVGGAPFKINQRSICQHLQQKIDFLMVKQRPEENQVMFQIKIENSLEGKIKEQLIKDVHQNEQKQHKEAVEAPPRQVITKINMMGHGLQAFECQQYTPKETFSLMNYCLE